MAKFVFILKNEKLKTYTVIAWLIIGLNFMALLYVGIRKYDGIMAIPFYAATLLFIIFLFRLISDREAVESDSLNLSFSVAVIAWIVLQYYWAAVTLFVLFLFEDISRRKLIILVYDDRIVYPSFPKRTIEWKEVSNAILKDGWLTIDLKNNKILQNEVMSPSSEIDFNEFCQTQIQALKK
ncbi:MAG: hypothetical protein Q8941_10490 [Bacteroidota bacterium]|nr:hypothetical protein [Bacteroidota bacterium]